MNADEKFCLKWNDFQENIKTSFGDLRGEKDFADVTLACEDGEVVGHKVILASCSPFFKRLLKRTKNHQHPLIFMRGLKTSHLTTVIDFIYHGEVNIHQEELEGFLLLAEELELKGLTGGLEDTGTGTGVDTGMENAGNTGTGNGTVMGNWQTQKQSNSEFAKRKYKTSFKTEKYPTSTISNQDIEIADNGAQIQERYQQTLVPTEMTPKPKVHIASEIIQMRETMFEKLGGLWTCKVCNFSSKDRSHLREHVEKHIEGVEYPCNLCGKILRSSKSLRSHYHKGCPVSQTRVA